MKKLFFGIVIITLPVIAYFEYMGYKRFRPPADYEYVLSDSIDIHYHDEDLVSEYYKLALEVGTFARSQWRTHGIDVRFPESENNDEVIASKYYNELLRRINLIERTLVESERLKAIGFTDNHIQQLESGHSEVGLHFVDTKHDLTSLVIGDEGELVWELQKQLINKGYEHQLDGVFGTDTREALLSFQRENGLYPSGRMSEITFKALFK